MNDPILCLDRLTIRHPSGFSVGPCDGAFAQGLFHLKGGNGTGKTTLLKAMCGEVRAQKGRCTVFGKDIWETPLARRHIGYLAADPELPDFFRIEECWRFHASMRRQPEWDGRELQQALRLNGDMLLAHTSAGQRHAAELLAALAGDPVVLLLDEPFASLDQEVTEMLVDWLDEWRKDHVVLLTSHQDVPVPVDGSWTLKKGEPLKLGFE